MILGNGWGMAPINLPPGGAAPAASTSIPSLDFQNGTGPGATSTTMLSNTAAELRARADAGETLTAAELAIVYADAGITVPTLAPSSPSPSITRDVMVAVISGVLIAIVTALLLKRRK